MKNKMKKNGRELYVCNKIKYKKIYFIYFL